MEIVRASSSEGAPKSGASGVLSKIDEFLFVPKPEDRPSRIDVISPPDSKTAALDALRQKLVADITRSRTLIEEARVKDVEADNKPRGRIGRMLYRKSMEEENERYLLQPDIDRNLKVITAINKGDEQAVVNHLVDKISKMIHYARMSVMISEDRSCGHFFIDTAQNNLNFLSRIDPEKAKELQQKLDKKTGNPLEKF